MKKDLRTPLDRLAFSSLIVLLPCLIFSYLPVITLGTISGVHIDLSLLYVLMTLVIVLHLPFAVSSLPKLLHSSGWKLLLGFTAYIWLSVVWSPNHTRAVITASFITALLLLSSVIALRLPELIKKKKLLLQLSLWAFIASSLLALWQIIADAVSIPSSLTGLPQMYSGDVFGIARPTAFALEPQFFGSLLLVPLLWSAWHVLTTSAQRSHYILLGSSATLLSLTLSRGALLAAFVGLITLAILAHPHFKAVFRVSITVLVSIVLSISITFSIGSMRHDTISGVDTVKRVINQLSLGIIKLELPSKPKDPIQSAPPQSTKKILPSTEISGYISSSTSSRLTMSDAAFKLWRENSRTIFFGVGIGGFGATLHQQIPKYSTGSIVGNYFAEMLVETGIIGLLIFLCFITSLFVTLYRQKAWLLFALSIAFIAQWFFFSGNANVVHVWVVFGLSLGVSLLNNTSSKQKPKLVTT